MAEEREMVVKRRISAVIDLVFKVSGTRGHIEDYSGWCEQGIDDEGGRRDRDQYVAMQRIY